MKDALEMMVQTGMSRVYSKHILKTASTNVAVKELLQMWVAETDIKERKELLLDIRGSL